MLVSHVFEIPLRILLPRFLIGIVVSVGVFLEASEGIIQKRRHQSRILIFTFLVIAIVEDLDIEISWLLGSSTHDLLRSLNITRLEWLQFLDLRLLFKLQVFIII